MQKISLFLTLFIMIGLYGFAPATADSNFNPDFNLNFSLWGSEEKIIKVVDLPDTAAFKLDNKLHLDVGYKFTQYYVLSLPVWNTDGEWTGYIGASDQFFNISREKIEELAQNANITLPDEVVLSFWERIGGKLVVITGLCIIIFMIFRLFRKKY